jgi:hypothetical protein
MTIVAGPTNQSTDGSSGVLPWDHPMMHKHKVAGPAYHARTPTRTHLLHLVTDYTHVHVRSTFTQHTRSEVNNTPISHRQSTIIDYHGQTERCKLFKGLTGTVRDACEYTSAPDQLIPSG